MQPTLPELFNDTNSARPLDTIQAGNFTRSIQPLENKKNW